MTLKQLFDDCYSSAHIAADATEKMCDGRGVVFQPFDPANVTELVELLTEAKKAAQQLKKKVLFP